MIAKCALSVAALQRAPMYKWWSLYTYPPGSSERIKRKMDPTVYAGRLLMSASIRDVGDADVPQTVKPSGPPPPIQMAKAMIYVDLYDGFDFPPFVEKVFVEVACAAEATSSEPRATKHHAASFNEQIGELCIVAPLQQEDMPDIFINFWAKTMTSSFRFGFARIEAGTIARATSEPLLPSLLILSPDTSCVQMKGDIFAGGVVAAVSFSLSQAHKRAPLVPMRPQDFEFRLSLYCARDLPAGDSSGSCDPYFFMRCGAQKSKPSTKRRFTVNPSYFEVLQFPVRLNMPLTTAAPLSLNAIDWDRVGADTFLGRVYFAPQDVLTGALSEAKWHPLFFDNPDERQGSVFAGLELLPKDRADATPVTTISPPNRDCILEISVVGLRGLKPLGMLSIQNPFVEFDCGEGDKAKTRPSSTPSPINPNLLDVVRIPFKCPTDERFAPYVNVKVKDSRGISNATLGFLSIPIGNFLEGKGSTSVSRRVSKVDADDIRIDVDGGAEADTDVDTDDDGDENKPLLTQAKRGGKKKGNVRLSVKSAKEDATDNGVANRPSVKGDLERSLAERPFEEFAILRGRTRGLSRRQVKKRNSKNVEQNEQKQVGVLKARVKVVDASAAQGAAAGEFPPMQRYVVRIYVLRGINLNPKDIGGTSDPYIVVTYGAGLAIKDRENVKMRTINPDFFKCFQFEVNLPGVPNVKSSLKSNGDRGFERQRCGVGF